MGKGGRPEAGVLGVREPIDAVKRDGVFDAYGHAMWEGATLHVCVCVCIV